MFPWRSFLQGVDLAPEEGGADVATTQESKGSQAGGGARTLTIELPQALWDRLVAEARSSGREPAKSALLLLQAHYKIGTPGEGTEPASPPAVPPGGPEEPTGAAIPWENIATPPDKIGGRNASIALPQLSQNFSLRCKARVGAESSHGQSPVRR